MTTLPEHIAGLIRQGRKIEAIKLIREETGVGLAEAKSAVEQLSRDRAFDEPVAMSPEQTDAEVRRLAYAGQKVQAVKLLREQSGLGLKEAVEQVERLPVDPAMAARGARARLVVVVVMALAVLVGLVAVFLGIVVGGG